MGKQCKEGSVKQNSQATDKMPTTHTPQNNLKKRRYPKHRRNDKTRKHEIWL